MAVEILRRAMDQVFKALSAPIRREILELLASGELSATQISENFSVSQPTISHHLSLLKKAELVGVRREGNTLYYSIKTSVVEDVLRFMYKMKGQK